MFLLEKMATNNEIKMYEDLKKLQSEYDMKLRKLLTVESSLQQTLKPLAKLTITIMKDEYAVFIYNFENEHKINKFWTLKFVCDHGDDFFTLVITKEKEEKKLLEIETRKLCQDPSSSFENIEAAIHKFRNCENTHEYKKFCFSVKVKYSITKPEPCTFICSYQKDDIATCQFILL